MTDFYLNFMKPDVWDGLVLAVTLIGAALATLQLYSDHMRYVHRKQREQARKNAPKTN